MSDIIFLDFALANSREKDTELKSTIIKELQSKTDFLKSLKVGEKVNEWTVSKIENLGSEFSVTFKGTLQTQAKYYNYFDVPWSYGMEFGNQLLLYFDDNTKNKLPFKNMSNFAYIVDKKSPKLAEGSYGIIDVKINEIILSECECDFAHDSVNISKIISLKEIGKTNFGEVENFKIYDEQNKIVEDFLGEPLTIK